MWFLHSSGRWRGKEKRGGGGGEGWYESAGRGGEGTGGKAHELKQGAHDEGEEPMHCNAHTHTHRSVH